MKYFLHDTSSFDDEKITELYLKFGYEGLGLFYTALEKIGKQEKPVKTDILKSQLRVGKKLNKCWKFMEEIRLLSSNNGETFNKQLLNFSEKYQIKKEKTREKVMQWRKRQEDIENVTSYVPICNPCKVKESKVNTNWRNDFNIYLTECRKGYSDFMADEDLLKTQQRLNPGINIKLSIEKGFINFWGTEAGWDYKRKKKSKVINWKSTIINSISMNKVYLPKQ